MNTKELKNNLKNELKRNLAPAIIYSLIILLMLLSLYIYKYKGEYIYSLIYVATALQLIYFLKYNRNLFNKIYTGILLSYSIMLFLNNNFPIISALIVIMAVWIISIIFPGWSYNKLWNSDNYAKMILWYLLFSISFNLFFTLVYAFTILLSNSPVLLINNQNISSNLIELITFSFSVFYNHTQYYIIQGYALRLVVLIHIVASYIIHIVGLAIIINKINKRK